MGGASRSFAAPEQLKGQPITVSADIYSFGKLLNYCMEHCAGKAAVSPSKRKELEAVVKRSLHVLPDHRYADIASLKQDLLCWQQHYPLSFQVNQSHVVARKWLFRRRMLVASALIIFSSACGAFYLTNKINVEQNQSEEVAKQLDQIIRLTAPQQFGQGNMQPVQLLQNSFERVIGSSALTLASQYRIINTLVESMFGLGEYQKLLDMLQQTIQIEGMQTLDNQQENSLTRLNIMALLKLGYRSSAHSLYLSTLAQQQNANTPLRSTLLLQLSISSALVELFGEQGREQWQQINSTIIANLSLFNDKERIIIAINEIYRLDRNLDYAVRKHENLQAVPIADIAEVHAQMVTLLADIPVTHPEFSTVIRKITELSTMLQSQRPYIHQLVAALPSIEVTYGLHHPITVKTIGDIAYVYSVVLDNPVEALPYSELAFNRSAHMLGAVRRNAVERHAWVLAANGQQERSNAVRQLDLKEVVNTNDELSGVYTSWANYVWSTLEFDQTKALTQLSELIPWLKSNKSNMNTSMNVDSELLILQALKLGLEGQPSKGLALTITNLDNFNGLSLFPIYLVQEYLLRKSGDFTASKLVGSNHVEDVKDLLHLYDLTAIYQDINFWLAQAQAELGETTEAQSILQETFDYNHNINPSAENFWLRVTYTIAQHYKLKIDTKGLAMLPIDKRFLSYYSE
jgi:hypothetical protein